MTGGIEEGRVGTPAPRLEDPRLLTGRGRYVADLTAPHLAHAAFLRSTVPHARITVDASAARTAPGVVAVFTAADLAGTLGPVSFDASIPGMTQLVHTALADDRVRLVGDPVAMVVAESRYLAEDALELIEVRYDELPPVPDVATALDPAAPALYDVAPGNVPYHDSARYGDVDGAFRNADRVIGRTLRQHRYMAAPLETRGGLAAYEPAGGELTYQASAHAPHLMRMVLAAHLRLPPHRVRVVVPDMGGSFGSKWGITREDLLVCAAAVRTGRPVRWIEDRRENLLVGGHARDESLHLEAAVRADGTLLGLRARLVMDIGAYSVIPMNPAFFTLALRLLIPGPYRVPAYDFEVSTVCTNKGPYVAYRGPWAVETWAREVLLDIVAGELGLAPEEIRRRNLVTPAEQPFRTAAGWRLDGTRAPATLERALELADLPRFRAEQRRARERGEVLGFGLATFIEPSPGGPEFLAMSGGGKETARVRVEPTGEVSLFTSQIPHGQGHETTLAQVVAAEFGLPYTAVRVVHGDTDATPFSMVGTGGSRAATFGGGAARRAARAVRDQVLRLASGMLGAPPEELALAGGRVYVRERPATGLSMVQLAGMVSLAPAYLPPDTPTELAATATHDGADGGFAQATHCCWVRVDPGTGQVEITRYLVVEDCGSMINPAVVEGQIRGGTAQGLGGVLHERLHYDETARPLSGTLRDYLLPTAADVPPIEIVHLGPEPGSGPPDHRGVGEGGAICAPPAITNALSDALGIEITQQAVTPSFVLTALRKAGATPADPLDR
ncbi:xanthine dehydrogenase family protein molybdopterin-binding subunit [Micromonospora sp. I033]